MRPIGRYLICLIIQSIAAFTILAAIQYAFRAVSDGLGRLHLVSPTEFGLVFAAICGFQAAYWYRLRSVEIPQWRGVVFSHIIGFASRLSFIFGGALFSLYFLRHAPELSSSEGAMILLPRVAMLLASLFCLYCYTLELDRLASALQVADRKGLEPGPTVTGAPASPNFENSAE